MLVTRIVRVTLRVIPKVHRRIFECLGERVKERPPAHARFLADGERQQRSRSTSSPSWLRPGEEQLIQRIQLPVTKILI